MDYSNNNAHVRASLLSPAPFTEWLTELPWTPEASRLVDLDLDLDLNEFITDRLQQQGAA